MAVARYLIVLRGFNISSPLLAEGILLCLDHAARTQARYLVLAEIERAVARGKGGNILAIVFV